MLTCPLTTLVTVRLHGRCQQARFGRRECVRARYGPGVLLAVRAMLAFGCAWLCASAVLAGPALRRGRPTVVWAKRARVPPAGALQVRVG